MYHRSVPLSDWSKTVSDLKTSNFNRHALEIMRASRKVLRLLTLLSFGCGVALLGLSLHLVLSTNFGASAAALAALGGCVVLLSVLGFVGAGRDKSRLLLLFFFANFVLAAGLFVACYATFFLQSALESWVKHHWSADVLAALRENACCATYSDAVDSLEHRVAVVGALGVVCFVLVLAAMYCVVRIVTVPIVMRSMLAVTNVVFTLLGVGLFVFGLSVKVHDEMTSGQRWIGEIDSLRCVLGSRFSRACSCGCSYHFHCRRHAHGGAVGAGHHRLEGQEQILAAHCTSKCCCFGGVGGNADCGCRLETVRRRSGRLPRRAAGVLCKRLLVLGQAGFDVQRACELHAGVRYRPLGLLQLHRRGLRDAPVRRRRSHQRRLLGLLQRDVVRQRQYQLRQRLHRRHDGAQCRSGPRLRTERRTWAEVGGRRSCFWRTNSIVVLQRLRSQHAASVRSGPPQTCRRTFAVRFTCSASWPWSRAYSWS
jgi:hypothetical protein